MDIFQSIFFIKDKYNINTIIKQGDRLNNAVIKDETLAYEGILVVDDLDKFNERFFYEIGDVILLWSDKSKDEYDYVVIFKEFDYDKLKIKIRESIDIEKVFLENSLSEIYYDRENIYDKTKVANDITQRLIRPDENEFYQEANSFFSLIYEVGLSMKNDEVLRSQLLYEEARRKLLKMAEIYVGSEYDFLVNTGNLGKNINAYIDKDLFNKIVESVSKLNKEQMWTSIFNTCTVYRKFGLKASENLSYSYPKKTDVEIIKFLRKIWEETK